MVKKKYKTNQVNKDFPDFEFNISKPSIPQNQIFLKKKKKKPIILQGT